MALECPNFEYILKLTTSSLDKKHSVVKEVVLLIPTSVRLSHWDTAVRDFPDAADIGLPLL